MLYLPDAEHDCKGTGEQSEIAINTPLQWEKYSRNFWGFRNVCTNIDFLDVGARVQLRALFVGGGAAACTIFGMRGCCVHCIWEEWLLPALFVGGGAAAGTVFGRRGCNVYCVWEEWCSCVHCVWEQGAAACTVCGRRGDLRALCVGGGGSCVHCV